MGFIGEVAEELWEAREGGHITHRQWILYRLGFAVTGSGLATGIVGLVGQGMCNKFDYIPEEVFIAAGLGGVIGFAVLGVTLIAHRGY